MADDDFIDIEAVRRKAGSAKDNPFSFRKFAGGADTGGGASLPRSDPAPAARKPKAAPAEASGGGGGAGSDGEGDNPFLFRNFKKATSPPAPAPVPEPAAQRASSGPKLPVIDTDDSPPPPRKASGPELPVIDAEDSPTPAPAPGPNVVLPTIAVDQGADAADAVDDDDDGFDDESSGLREQVKALRKRAERAERLVEKLKLKEQEETEALEETIRQVEKNLVTSVRRAEAAEQKVRELTARLNAGGGGGGVSGDVYARLERAEARAVYLEQCLDSGREQRAIAAKRIVEAAEAADQQLRTMGMGVKMLRDVAGALQASDRVQPSV